MVGRTRAVIGSASRGVVWILARELLSASTLRVSTSDVAREALFARKGVAPPQARVSEEKVMNWSQSVTVASGMPMRRTVVWHTAV